MGLWRNPVIASGWQPGDFGFKTTLFFLKKKSVGGKEKLYQKRFGRKAQGAEKKIPKK